MRLRLFAIDSKPSMLCYVTLTCSSVVQTAYTCEQRMLVSAVASSSQYFMGARLDVLHEGVKTVVRQPTREDSRITLWGAIGHVENSKLQATFGRNTTHLRTMINQDQEKSSKLTMLNSAHMWDLLHCVVLSSLQQWHTRLHVDQIWPSESSLQAR